MNHPRRQNTTTKLPLFRVKCRPRRRGEVIPEDGKGTHQLRRRLEEISDKKDPVKSMQCIIQKFDCRTQRLPEREKEKKP